MMDTNIRLFVKFGESKYVRRLFNGKMYFSNAVRFRKIEKESNLKGQGDAFEAILQLKNGCVIMTNPCTGQSFSQQNTTVRLGLAGTENIPIFCITCISEEDCEVLGKNGKRILTVSNTIRDTMKAHFPKADTVGVFFQPQSFIDSLSGLGITTHGKVMYYDFSPEGAIKEMIDYVTQQPGAISQHNHPIASMYMEINNGEHSPLKITEQNMKHILFCKDEFFMNEKEYRIILPQKRITEPKEYTIRWGKQLRKIYSVDEFFNGIEL